MSDDRVLATASDIRRAAVLTQVFGYLAEGHKVEQAAELAGVPYRTLYDWIKAGYMEPILSEAIARMRAEIDTKILGRWPEAMEKLMSQALGISDNPERPIYARDQQAAMKMLYEWVIKPAMETQPVATPDAEEFLNTKAKAGFGWTPKLQPGGKVTIILEQGQDGIIDVSPSENE